MSNNVFIYAYSPASNSAKLLAEKLGAKRIKHTNSKFKGSRNKWVVVWGASRISNESVADNVYKCKVFNSPRLASMTSDKIETFKFLSHHRVPSVEFTTNIRTASQWIVEGNKVVIRNLVESHSGRGIEIVDSVDDLHDAPLYTKYFPKKKEFRIHVSGRGLFYVQRKVIRKSYLEEVGADNVNWQIRNAANGFVFQRYGIDVPDAVKELADELKKSLISEFGRHFIVCADVLYNEQMDKAVVCELNSAPGLDDTSAEIYANEIKEVIENKSRYTTIDEMLEILLDINNSTE